MNWTDKLSRIDECVTIGRCKINQLLFADDLVLAASSESGLQPLKCKRANEIFVKKSEELLDKIHSSVIRESFDIESLPLGFEKLMFQSIGHVSKMS